MASRAKETQASSIDSLEIKSPLPPLGKTPKKKEVLWKRLLWGIVRWLLIILFLLVIAASGEIIFLYTRFTAFYVNGDSMYPTLNKNATRSYGGVNNGTWGNFVLDSQSGAWYNVDFGFYDANADFRVSLKRFDVVVTKYSSQDAGASKIKRIIGMPGESLYFNEAGELFVKAVGASSYVNVPQTFSMRLQNETLSGSNIVNAKGPEHPAVLGADEYFLCGDNRGIGCSTDSRTSTGPIKADWLVGRAMYVVGLCRYTYEVQQGGNPGFIWSSVKMPWSFQNL